MSNSKNQTMSDFRKYDTVLSHFRKIHKILIKMTSDSTKNEWRQIWETISPHAKFYKKY